MTDSFQSTDLIADAYSIRTRLCTLSSALVRFGHTKAFKGLSVVNNMIFPTIIKELLVDIRLSLFGLTRLLNFKAYRY